MSPEAPAEISGAQPIVAIEKKRAPLPHAFKPGNPGRPKGATNHSTRVREQIIASVGKNALRRFKHRLNGNSDPKQFEKALDQVISLLGPDKPLVNIDQSRHTHFTVVLDGPQPGQASTESSNSSPHPEAESSVQDSERI